MEMNRREFIGAATVACGCMLSAGCLVAAETTEPVQVGKLKDFAKDGVNDSFVQTKGFFVIRQKGRLYAASSACSHKTSFKVVSKPDLNDLYCPKHGSRFTLAGTVTKGPAKRSLPRYGISANAQGEVSVDPSKTFDENRWGEEGSFLKV